MAIKMIRKALIGVLLICTPILFLGAFINTASASTLYVPDDYSTIHAAVDAANAGDTIIVREGTFTENLDMNKDHLTIKSEKGAEKTIVQAADSSDDVFEVMADYVKINGLTVKGANGSRKAGLSGIRLENVDHCAISNNNVLSNFEGIYLFRSSNNTISNNNVSNNDDGISLWISSNNNIVNNLACHNGYAGIFLQWLSSNNMLTNNTANSNGNRGIELQDSSYNTLSGNIANSNYYAGIVVSGDKREDYQNSIGISNTVDGKPIYYFYDIHDRIISGLDTTHLTVASSTNITIKENNISGGAGVHLGFVDNSTVSINTISENRWGITLCHSTNNTIIDNSLYSNSNDGIVLWYSSNNAIADNKIVGSGGWGIRPYDESHHNTITGNTISNYHTGICFRRASSNLIYFNNFTGNSDSVESSNSTNLWNPTSKITYVYKGKTYTNYLGNYWSDYRGSDADGDGIGDIPYSITSDNDNYPLVQSFENYKIGLGQPESGEPDILIGYFYGPMDFGDVNVGNFKEKWLEIWNIGTATLSINSVTRTSGSPDFSPTYGYTPFDIEAGRSKLFLIFFHPSSEGSKNATFTIIVSRIPNHK